MGVQGTLNLTSSLGNFNQLLSLRIELFDNNIGDHAAQSLSSSLEKLKNLSTLSFYLNHSQYEELITNNQEEIKLNDKQQTTQERQYFYQSDSTLQKFLRSQIFKQAQNKLFSNAVCQIINQEKKQSALISYSANHYNPQDLNSKSQQSQQFIQISITSQRENATITKNILVYSYQQAALLLVEQLQKLPLEIHNIFQRILSMTVQSQKELRQHPKTESQRNDLVEQQFLNKKESPFPFQTTQLIKIFEEFNKIREMNKYQTSQFQQSLEIKKEKTEKTEQEIKDILQRLNKQVSENMQEQPHDILEQISKIPKHYLISQQCQNYQELPKQTQLDIQFGDEFDFNQFELEVQKRQKKLLNLKIKPKKKKVFIITYIKGYQK
ncbi:hypothetical protein ABPG72_020357 [Tetrahymena utriculariae]